MSKYRVWWKDEFEQQTDEEREDSAWVARGTESFFTPGQFAPPDDAEEAAELYADYFHSDRDGWENTWPIEFVVHDGEKFFIVSVDREYDPVFSASKPKEFAPGVAP
jgi:hypothetical protein